MIPDKLYGYRFITLGKITYDKQGKKLIAGFAPSWQKNNFNFEQMKKKTFTNYGVVGDSHNIIIDIDKGKGFEEMKELTRKLPETFTDSTPSGGLHLFYYSLDEIKGARFGNNAGEIRAEGMMVIGPQSKMEEGKQWTTVKNIPIATITQKQIDEVFGKWLTYVETTYVDVKPKEPDTSRSAQEYWHLVKLIKKGRNKEEIWKKMQVYAKWSETGEAYKEHQYKKAGGKVKEGIEKTAEKLSANATANVEILTLLLSKKRGEATEELVKEFLQKNKVYTTRDDERSEVWIYEQGIYVPQGRSYIREHCRQQLGGAYTGALGAEVIGKVEVDTFINQQEFFENKYIEQIAVENGILNVITEELTPFTPDKIFFNKLPMEYNPQATCPTIKKHLETVLKSKEDVTVMEELFGSVLYKDYFIEKATMLTGEGRNGKSKTLDLIKRFLGVENCSSIPLQQFETDPYAKGDLLNKMANMAGDIDSKALKSTGAMKMLTGRDLISAQRKYLPRVKFVNFAKLIFAANKIPRTVDISQAFWSRWIILEFPYKFLSQKEIDKTETEERKNCKLADSEIISKLTTPEELSGLLNLAIKGLHRLRKQKDFSYNKSTKEVMEMWIRKSDSFAAFLMDCVEESETRTTKIELRKAYSLYCKKHKLKMVSDKIIKDVITETFAVSEERESLEGERLWYWDGITIKEPQKKVGG